MNPIKVALATAALAVGLTACTRTVEVTAPSTTKPSPSHTAVTELSTTEPSSAEPAPIVSDDVLNADWAIAAAPVIKQLGVLFNEMSNASSVSEMVGYCAEMKPLDQQFGDSAPDTEAGRHARAAADLYVQAADACLSVDLERASSLLEQAGPEMDAATAALTS